MSLTAAWLCLAVLGADDAPRLPDVKLASAEGVSTRLTDLAGKQGTLVVLMSTECPISNGYVPLLNRIAKQRRDQGLAVCGLNPNASQSLREMAEHRAEYEITFPVLKDVGGRIATSWGATICPEAFLFDANAKLVYRGRLDDRYVRRGAGAKAVQDPDLLDAIAAMQAGKPIPTPRTEPIGCPIDREEQRPQSTRKRPHAVTWSGQIADIVQRRCQLCHRDGGIGPFALESYEDAVLWSEDLATFTANREMPPWLPKHDVGRFANDRSMPQAEIDLIGKWVADGCPRGNPSQNPQPIQFPEGWRLGKPDLELTPAQEYEVTAEGEDDYRCFVMANPLDTLQFIRGLDVAPGNKAVVHHVLIFVDQSGRARQLDKADPRPGYASLGGFPGFLPSDFLGGWAPGGWAGTLPDGMAKPLPAGCDLVIQVHYHKTGKVERDRTRIAFYFSKEPPERLVRMMGVSPLPGPLGGLRIPAGAKRHEVRSAVVMPDDMRLVSITPHMHLLGQDMTVTATLPDGTRKPLLALRRWDFNWQERYRLSEPLRLPKGTRVESVAHFDNSEANPYNPNRPPKLVTWGENTTDEMCIAFLELAPEQKIADPSELRPQTPAERMRFNLEARRLAGAKIDPALMGMILSRLRQGGDGSDLIDAPAFQKFLQQRIGGRWLPSHDPLEAKE